MWKVGIIGVVAVFLGNTIKRERNDFFVIIGMVTGLLIIGYMLCELKVVMDFFEKLIDMLPLDKKYFSMILKMLGVTYIAEFASSVCKDGGYQSVALQIENFAKIAIVVMSIPGLCLFIDAVEKFV